MLRLVMTSIAPSRLSVASRTMSVLLLQEYNSHSKGTLPVSPLVEGRPSPSPLPHPGGIWRVGCILFSYHPMHAPGDDEMKTIRQFAFWMAWGFAIQAP